jgi:hypothetical protein
MSCRSAQVGPPMCRQYLQHRSDNQIVIVRADNVLDGSNQVMQSRADYQ